MNSYTALSIYLFYVTGPSYHLFWAVHTFFRHKKCHSVFIFYSFFFSPNKLITNWFPFGNNVTNFRILLKVPFIKNSFRIFSSTSFYIIFFFLFMKEFLSYRLPMPITFYVHQFFISNIFVSIIACIGSWLLYRLSLWVSKHFLDQPSIQNVHCICFASSWFGLKI